MLSIRYSIIIAMLLASFVGGASEVEIERLINDFDGSNNKTVIANRFFYELRADGFIDEDVVMSAVVPEDSVSQQFYYWAGEWYCDAQDYERALRYALKALPLYDGPSDAKADCLNLLGVLYIRTGDFASAIEYVKECLDIDLRSGDNDRISSTYSTLAGTYIAADDPDAAQRYILEGMRYADKAVNSLRKTILMGMASEVCYKKGEFEKAVEYADGAYAIDSASGRPARAAIRLSQKATALVGLEKYGEAEAVFRKAFPMLIDAGNGHSLAIDYNQFGFMLLKQHRPAEAVKYFSEADRLFDRMGDLYNRLHSLQGLYESYWKINPDSAHIALQEFNLLKDSLYREASADALARYKVEFETDRLNEQIETHKNNRRRDFIIAGVILLLCVATGIWLHHWRVKRYRHELKQLMANIEYAAYTHASPVRTGEEALSENDAAVPDAKSDFERLVIEAVNDGLARREYSIGHIASRLNMSEQTFRRRFVEATGKLPKSFISAIQMNRAVTLLRDNKAMTISEVARECGFDELSAFSHSFKRSFGCSPSEYQANPDIFP